MHSVSWCYYQASPPLSPPQPLSGTSDFVRYDASLAPLQGVVDCVTDPLTGAVMGLGLAAAAAGGSVTPIPVGDGRVVQLKVAFSVKGGMVRRELCLDEGTARGGESLAIRDTCPRRRTPLSPPPLPSGRQTRLHRRPTQQPARPRLHVR